MSASPPIATVRPSKRDPALRSPPGMLFLIAQQFSLLVPDLKAVPVDYVMIVAQCFGGFERQFERLKRLHGMAAVSCDAKRSVYVMTLPGFSEKSV